jgi:hypothetical protein
MKRCGSCNQIHEPRWGVPCGDVVRVNQSPRGISEQAGVNAGGAEYRRAFSSRGPSGRVGKEEVRTPESRTSPVTPLRSVPERAQRSGDADRWAIRGLR